jgi:hypothetical protein
MRGASAAALFAALLCAAFSGGACRLSVPFCDAGAGGASARVGAAPPTYAALLAAAHGARARADFATAHACYAAALARYWRDLNAAPDGAVQTAARASARRSLRDALRVRAALEALTGGGGGGGGGGAALDETAPAPALVEASGGGGALRDGGASALAEAGAARRARLRGRKR